MTRLVLSLRAAPRAAHGLVRPAHPCQDPCLLHASYANVCLGVPDVTGRVQADGPHLVMVSRIAVAVWAVIMGIAMCIAQVANININWLILLIGALSSSSSLRMHCT